MRPESELLFCAARRTLDSQVRERLRTLLECPLDWTYLVTRAEGHGVLPLLYRHLDAIDGRILPERGRQHLRERFHSNTRRNLLLTAELLELLEVFNQHGIRAVPFKGPVLAEALYGDVSLRQFGDLDVLVQAGDVRGAQDILLSRGYEFRDRLNPRQEAASLRYEWVRTLVRDRDRITVDLHWDFAPRFRFPLEVEHLWKRLQPSRFAGQTVLSLSPSDLLLILCLHGTKHRWQRLVWVTDVAELIDAHADMDWAALLEQSDLLGSKRVLFLGLFLAQDLLDARLPENVSRRIRSDPRVRELTGQVRSRLFEAGGIRPILGDFLFDIRVRERPQDKVRYCSGFAFAPTANEWRLVSLPTRLMLLYYLIRPIRLAAICSWAFLQYFWTRSMARIA